MALKHNSFSCKIPGCGFKTNYKRGLQRHVRGVHNNDRPYGCPSEGCKFKAKCRQNLKQHLTIHSNEKPFACNVPGCNYTCKWKANLASHTSLAHSDKKPFKCSKCDYRAKVRADLIRHGRTHVKKHFQCQDQNCSYQTASLHCYRLHGIAHIKEEKPTHVCTFCSSRFPELNKLQAHIKRHTREKPYRCSHCEYTTVRIAELRGHARRIHHIHVVPRGEEDQVSKCRACNQKFWNNSELVLHSMHHLKPVVLLKQLKLQVL